MQRQMIASHMTINFNNTGSDVHHRERMNSTVLTLTLLLAATVTVTVVGKLWSAYTYTSLMWTYMFIIQSSVSTN